jgi:hypothetical protein
MPHAEFVQDRTTDALGSLSSLRERAGLRELVLRPPPYPSPASGGGDRLPLRRGCGYISGYDRTVRE